MGSVHCQSAPVPRIQKAFSGFRAYLAVLVCDPSIAQSRLWLHSADRRTSGFLQVAPIETASARTDHHARTFIPEAVPIGR
jgi:hypothetical protein